jgi:hypothetical protein
MQVSNWKDMTALGEAEESNFCLVFLIDKNNSTSGDKYHVL